MKGQEGGEEAGRHDCAPLHAPNERAHYSRFSSK
jgi:hypothetical protein